MPQSNKVELKVVRKSAFPGKAHFSLGTAKVGSLVPIMVDEVIPNTTIDVKMAIAASLPPLASDTFMNVDYCVEAFFVPWRLIYGGFESFFTQKPENEVYVAAGSPAINKTTMVIPRLLVSNKAGGDTDESDNTILQDYHTLFDYFNAFYSDYSEDHADYIPIPLHLYVAYNLIWDNWYRNTLVQNSAFAKIAAWNISNQPSAYPFVSLPSSSYNPSYANIVLPDGYLNDTEVAFAAGSNSMFSDWPLATFADGHPFWYLRQRNFGFDYFTNSWPSAQQGNAQTVTPDAQGRISIAAIRGANSFQIWEETGQFCPRLVEAVKARYGAHLSDAIAQRPVCLGTGRYPVYSKSVDVTATNAGNINPMSATAGAQAGRAFANGTEHIIDSFTAQEPGFIFILGSLVPSVVYSTGVDRINTRYMYNVDGQRVEMADPLLQNTGNQPIYAEELQGNVQTLNAAGSPLNQRPVFSYTDRYADFMVKRNSVHGLMRLIDTGVSYSLNMFAAQRAFVGASIPVLGSRFLQIPTNYLDNVTAVRSQLSQFGYWYQCGFNYRCSMPLAQYSIPSLQNPAYEHGESVVVHRGGFRF